MSNFTLSFQQIADAIPKDKHISSHNTYASYIKSCAEPIGYTPDSLGCHHLLQVGQVLCQQGRRADPRSQTHPHQAVNSHGLFRTSVYDGFKIYSSIDDWHLKLRQNTFLDV